MTFTFHEHAAPKRPNAAVVLVAMTYGLSLGACDDCNKARVSEPTRVVVRAPSGSAAPAAAPVSASARVKPAGVVPSSLHGKIAYQRRDGGAPRLMLASLGAEGASPPRRLVDDLGEGVESIRFGSDGESLLYARNDKSAGDAPHASLWLVRADGSGNTNLAKCEHRCSIGGIGADGTVWYVDHGVSMIGTIKTVSKNGGTAAVWEGNPRKGWTECMLSVALSRDGKRLLIGVDNQLGWPACIDGGLQGLYVVPVDSAPSTTTRGPRITCFTKSKAKMNLSFAGLSFNPAGDRITFSVTDAWAEDASSEPVRWSCGLDGEDARQEGASAWRIEEEIDGAEKRLVAMPPTEGAPMIPVLAPMDPVDAWAVWHP